MLLVTPGIYLEKSASRLSGGRRLASGLISPLAIKRIRRAAAAGKITPTGAARSADTMVSGIREGNEEIYNILGGKGSFAKMVGDKNIAIATLPTQRGFAGQLGLEPGSWAASLADKPRFATAPYDKFAKMLEFSPKANKEYVRALIHRHELDEARIAVRDYARYKGVGDVFAFRARLKSWKMPTGHADQMIIGAAESNKRALSTPGSLVSKLKNFTSPNAAAAVDRTKQLQHVASSHVSPEVLVRESKNLHGVSDPELDSLFYIMRSTSGADPGFHESADRASFRAYTRKPGSSKQPMQFMTGEPRDYINNKFGPTARAHRSFEDAKVLPAGGNEPKVHGGMAAAGLVTLGTLAALTLAAKNSEQKGKKDV